MEDSNEEQKRGMVDPETLYTKQSCIGMVLTSRRPLAEALTASQVAAALAKSTKGR